MKLLFVIFSLGILPVLAQSPADPYDFPLKPGTTAWAQLNTGKEMWEVCQIPDVVLKNLSTEALAITCMNYPLYGDYISSNDIQSGILRMIDNFNGLKELSSRSDGAQKLIEIYAST